MTGMKEGAGEDPFADDEDDVTSEESESEGALGSSVAEGESPARSGAKSSDTQRQSRQQMQIPYKFRRDSVQDGRDRVPLFLQEETKRAEREALRDLEERFDADVSLTDLREALVKVGLERLDEVEDQLEEWGYGMTFD
jgi:hypothetical protein